jgi:hypothetical protein
MGHGGPFECERRSQQRAYYAQTLPADSAKVRDAVQLFLIGLGDIPMSAAFPPEAAAATGYLRT